MLNGMKSRRIEGKSLIGFIVVFVLLTLSSQIFADWTQFQYNPQHTGKTDDLGPQNGELDWSINLGVEISPFGGPSTGLFNGEETILLGTDNGVYLISLEGIIVDSISTSFPITSVVAINENIVYFGCGDTLMAYSPDSLYWSHEIGDNIFHVTIFEDQIYVCGGDKLWSFDLDGTLNWETTPLGGGIYNSAPAVDGSGNIYVATLGNAIQWYDFKVYSFNPDGTERWSESFLFFEEGIKMTPSIDANSNIYIASCGEFSIWGSSLISLDDTGEENWREDAEILYSSVALSNALYYTSIDIDGIISSDGITARDFEGDFLWEFSTASEITYSSPAISGNNLIYVGTDGGLFIALDDQGVLQWSYDTQEGGLGSPAIDSSMVYIASHQSLFAFKDVPTSANEVETPNISLSQNYPNPFNPRTAISYQLLADSWVDLSIYNIKGQKVKQLISDQFSAGKHTVIWNGKNNSSGVYFYKLISEGSVGRYTSTRKMILMK